MKRRRREFLALTTAGLAVGLLAPSSFLQAAKGQPFKAVVFDAFPIFDPRPIFALAEEIFPGRGMELSNVWRTRQFEYTWLRTLSGRYADFKKTTTDALIYAARTLKLELDEKPRTHLIDAYFQLKAWPDVRPALTALKEAGIRLGFLSDFTREMLEANVKGSGMDGYFEQLLSTDRAQAFKPDPRAYQLGIDAFKLKREEIVFAAFAGWDAAGAKTFGYSTFWVNRQDAAVEELDAPPDGTGSLADLVKFMLRESA
jgi:2-haloacid dehalogenase